MIWFSSDFHYFHANICYAISQWPDKEKTTRRFNTLHEMNEAIVNNINNCVKQNDVLYFLGDWSFGGIENIWNFRKRIVCSTIHFILGNHEQHLKKNRQIEICRDDRVYLEAFNIPYMKTSQGSHFVYLKDLFTSVQNYLEIEIDGQIFVLSHYPMEEWFEIDRKGAIHLHGHTHHILDNCEINTKYKRMDVGIDWKEFRPYSIDEILRIMNKRENKTHNIKFIK